MDEAIVKAVGGTLEKAVNLPGIRVNREKFLRSNLARYCTDAQLERAIAMGTTHANIPVKTLDKVAKGVISNETTQTVFTSAIAGIPGGAAMFATIPADLLQFYGHAFRAAQKLAYTYGWDDLTDTDEGTKAQLLVFLGTMSGVEQANKALATFFSKQGAKIAAEKAAASAFAKKWYFPILKVVAKEYATKMSTVPAWKTVFGKAIPVIAPVTSGALTLATFKPMAHKLQERLSELANMSPGELSRCIEVNDYRVLK